MPISLLIVDDQALVRSGLRALLERGEGLTVAGEAANGREAVAMALEHAPDVVLMDLRMPVMDGVEATRRIRSDPRLVATQVIALTTFDADEDVFAVLAAGAAGFLLKDTRPEQLREAVRVVHGGGSLMSAGVGSRVIRAALDGRIPSVRPDLVRSLTERETEVLIAIGRGLSNDEIAATLVLSPATARTYVSRLLAKLGARDRAQLVVLAYDSGLVRPG